MRFYLYHDLGDHSFSPLGFHEPDSLRVQGVEHSEKFKELLKSEGCLFFLGGFQHSKVQKKTDKTMTSSKS